MNPVGLNLLKVTTYAKLNLYLRVFPPRPDGYHNLVSVMQTVDLTDELSFEPGGEDISIECSHPDVPTDGGNVVAKAYRLLRQTFPTKVGSVKVHIAKNIPPQSGLAGGSGNAAGTLAALNHMFQLSLTTDDMVKLGSVVGSDVPFMVNGGCAIISGRGEIIEKLPRMAEATYIVLTPLVMMGTADAYRLLDEWRSAHMFAHGNPSDVLDKIRTAWTRALGSGDFAGLVHNDFEEPIFASRKEIADVKRSFEELGIDGHMTGSGSAFYAIVPDSVSKTGSPKAEELAGRLGEIYGDSVHVCRPTEKGCQIDD